VILVTGAGGLIGAPLVRRLVQEGRQVLATDMVRPAGLASTRFIAADLADAAAVKNLIEDAGISDILHTGGISGRAVAPGDPFRVMSVNVMGTLAIAEAARHAGVRRIVTISSIGVYGDQPNRDPVAEATPLAGADMYCASKVAAEGVLRAYRHDFALPVVTLRASSVYGPGRKTPCFINYLLDSHKAGKRGVASSGQDGKRQFLYVEDAVSAVIAALDAPEIPEFAYNISGGTWLTEAEIAQAAMDAVPGLKVDIEPVEPWYIDGRMGELDMRAAQRDLGYAPRVGIEAGIAMTWKARKEEVLF